MKEIKGIPTVSVFKFYRNARRILKNPLPFHRENFTELGDTWRLKLAVREAVIFSRNPDFAKYVLQKNQKNYRKTTIQTVDIAKYLGQGLLTAEGELWKKQRKMLQPAFHKKQLVNLLDTIKTAIDTELDKIETGRPFDIFPIYNDLAFQTVVKSLFSGAATKEEIARLQYITEAAQKMVVRELRQPYLNWWFRMRGEIQRHLDLTQEARGILARIVEERQQSGVRHNDLLDMMLDARYEDGEPMPREQLLDEILILFTAGHETTSNALTFTSQLLANHPEYQDKIFQEVQKAEKESSSLMEFLQALQFTQHVVEESMRLYPPAYFIDRRNIEEDEFEGIKIPKDTDVLFSVYEIHRHKDHWDDPDKFFPERFARADASEFSSHYFPFGAGPRKCIGNNFAMYEMIMAVAEVVKRYRIEALDPEIQIQPLITLKPKNAILRFNSR
ncbi:cytochrome P450 [Salinimicrobium sp. TH3]|uniref:cytochrome P450 n=1 Tax=Salinimicrobium sp. TH3 TaxID=2997342 RepID=UPI00227461D1|nr:cytochrome P450 [Salinimicrobium sp. TH3]MCY2685792.1 cytochrome P450 [Salinimicrobium sp. TH3]